MLEETDHAWAAGIIDGEGYIGMTMQKPGTNRRMSTGFQVKISVRMTCERTIRRLFDLYGGTFKLCLPKNPQKHRTCYEWYVGDLKTFEVLCKLVPYLVTKQDQAQLVIEYRNNCYPEPERGRFRGRSCTQELVQMRFSYYEALRELNKRGVE